ncbi:hypothetical protein [Microcella alkalica]|uniref:Protein kinase domain-containing protein n=1 Tax=Microcella alkalica TaxID=355930 RepID=A0A839E976_9MICO|nr:hypothetical protein [Microcella alkalica]MBA8846992.1 hypothetical protein [Microcella alkalica]
MTRFVPAGDRADRPSRWAPTVSTEHHQDGAAVIGGYRLVRRLGKDEEVVTWLARGGDETVVLRSFRGSASDLRIDAEIGARERLSGRHVPELLDVATSRSGRPVAVVGAVVGPLLSDLLARSSGELRAGHVTTILAPIAALLDAAHEVGATVGRLDASGIRIDRSGAPVLVALGAASVAAPLPARFRDREPSIRADRDALLAFGASLVELVDARERDAVMAALSSASEPGAVELALFDCAAPLPLDLLTDPPRPQASPLEHPSAMPIAATTAVREVGAATADGTRSGAVGPVGRISTALGLPVGLAAPVDTAAAVLGGALRDRWARASRGRSRASLVSRPRRGVVIAGALGALALFAAAVLAAAETPPVTTARAEPPAASSGGSDAPLPDQPAQVAPPDAPEGTEQSMPEALASPEAEQWRPLVGALVDRWLACADAPSEDCIARVAHPGSSAEETLASGESALSTTGPGSGSGMRTWAARDGELVVVDRMGAAALVDLLDGETATASLLVVRSEAGWRVRAVMP